jgi:peptidyl-prolyl cis-trans isomerase D
MISWMQKHNKYLVWTIWIATIAFIGAGFVGWGSYDLSAKAGNVAKIGDIEIKQSTLNMTYANIYKQYNETMQGKLDDKKAKELGLVQQAFKRVAIQARILNFSKEMGIIVSDKEVAKKLQEIVGFQKDGIFQKELYQGYLKSQRLKAKIFESVVRKELTIQKTLSLLTVQGKGLEIESISAAMNVSDKLAYQVLTDADLSFTSKEADVKAYWEKNKENYQTAQMYTLSMFWTPSSKTVVTEEEIKSHYETNSFNYTNATGKQLNFEEAKEQASIDLKLKKTKKSAQKSYIAFKKGKLESSEKITLPVDDLKLTADVWSKVKEKSTGDILKPNIVSDAYVTIKIEDIVLPKVKSYEAAKATATADYTVLAKKDALLKLAEETLKNFDESKATISDFVKLEQNVNLKLLNNQESLQFLQKLFTSTEEKGIISVSDKTLVYKIKEQKFFPVDENNTNVVNKTVNKLKKSTFESNLIKMLDKKYPTEVYRGGLIN